MQRREDFQSSSQDQEIFAGEIGERLRATLDALPHRITICLFTQKGENDAFNDAAKNLILAFQKVTSRIDFKEYDLADKLAGDLKITTSPTWFLIRTSTPSGTLACRSGKKVEPFWRLSCCWGFAQAI